MTNRTLFTTTLLAAAIALAGCKPSTDAAAPGDAATPPPTVAPTTAEPAADEHATDVLREVDNAPAPEGLDVRAFAGRLEGPLPFPACPGIASTLELAANGTTALHHTSTAAAAATNTPTRPQTVRDAAP